MAVETEDLKNHLKKKTYSDPNARNIRSCGAGCSPEKS